MTRNLKRYHEQGDLHFISSSCYERRPLLGTARSRDIFLEILEEVRSQFATSVAGYVVMPEHVHLLLSEPRKGALSTLLQVLKQRVSHVLRQRRRISGQLESAFPCSFAGLRRFWQRRYYDFNVYSAQKLREKLDYIHANPVKRRLVVHPKDWPWSSWAFYAGGKQGVVTIDPSGEEHGGKKPHPLPKAQRVGHPRWLSRDEQKMGTVRTNAVTKIVGVLLVKRKKPHPLPKAQRVGRPRWRQHLIAVRARASDRMPRLGTEKNERRFGCGD